MKMMTPFQAVNAYVRQRGYKSVLIAGGHADARINAETVVHVADAADIKNERRSFDLIVIDGKRKEAEIVELLDWATKHLNAGGVIAVDGAMPSKFKADGDAWRVAWRLVSAGVEGASVYASGVGAGWLTLDFQAPKLRRAHKPRPFDESATFADFAQDRQAAVNFQGFSQDLAAPTKNKATITHEPEANQPEPSPEGGVSSAAAEPAAADRPARRKPKRDAEPVESDLGGGESQPEAAE